MRLTEEEYFKLIHRVPCPTAGTQTGWPYTPETCGSFPKPSKYHAVLTEVDNIKFQSKKEAKYYRELLCRVHAGEVKYFLRQVPFRLKGGVKYVVDFMEVWVDGSIHFVDVKGCKTEMYRVKKRLTEAEYPVRIEEA
jgi:hypothetical protein